MTSTREEAYSISVSGIPGGMLGPRGSSGAHTRTTTGLSDGRSALRSGAHYARALSWGSDEPHDPALGPIPRRGATLSLEPPPWPLAPGRSPDSRGVRPSAWRSARAIRGEGGPVVSAAGFLARSHGG